MRKSLVLVALVVVAALGSPAGAAASGVEPQGISFELYLGDEYVNGYAARNATVNVRWRDASGALKAEGAVASADSGYWSFRGPAGVALQLGDRLRVNDGSQTRLFVVPQLTAVANRVKNVFKGTAPAGSRIFIQCTYPGAPVPDIACDQVRVEVNDNGRWWHRPGWNIQGGDGAELAWRGAQGDVISFVVEAPYVSVTVGRAQVAGNGRMFSTADVALKNSTGQLLGSASREIAFGQYFTATLRDAAGDRVFVKSGQRVVSDVASDAAFVVPEIEATGDPATDTVRGRCQDTGRSAHQVWIRVYRTGRERGFAVNSTGADGSFSQDMAEVGFPDPAVVKHGDKLLITCLLINRDRVSQWFSVP